MFNKEALIEKLEELLQALNAWGAQVLYYDAVSRSLKVAASSGLPEDWDLITYDIDDSMNGQVVREAATLLLNEISADALAGETTKHEITAVLISPIVRNDEVLGTIQVMQDIEGRDFTRDDVALLEARAELLSQDFDGDFEGFPRAEQENPGDIDSMPF